MNEKVCITAVYARCNAVKKLEFWEDLESISNMMQYHWLVGGDFNKIRDEDEKQEDFL